MVRTEISLFMKNAPGELGKLTTLFGSAGINIDALTIQDASAYVQQLFKARGKSLKRIASAASYNSMRKDSVEFALVRILVSDTDKAVDLLSKNDYIFDWNIVAQQKKKLQSRSTCIYLYHSIQGHSDLDLLVPLHPGSL